MSTTYATYPIVAAQQAADDLSGGSLGWKPANDRQEEYLSEHYESCKRQIARTPEVSSRVFLTKGHALGIECGLDLKIEWPVVGEKVPLQAVNGREYAGVRLTAGLAFSKLHGGGGDMVSARTASGDIVNFAPNDRMIRPESLANAIAAHAALKRQVYHYDSAIVPMLDLDSIGTAEWLHGLTLIDSRERAWKIAIAKVRTKLGIDGSGLRSQSGMIRYSSVPAQHSRRTLTLDRPFLCWIERPGLSHPLFTGHITPEDWKAPS